MQYDLEDDDEERRKKTAGYIADAGVAPADDDEDDFAAVMARRGEEAPAPPPPSSTPARRAGDALIGNSAIESMQRPAAPASTPADDDDFDAYIAKEAGVAPARREASPSAPVGRAPVDDVYQPNTGAMIASGFGTWLQGKDFDTKFWQGQQDDFNTRKQQGITNARGDRALDIADFRARNPRAADSPEALRLRERALELQKERLGLGTRSEDRKDIAEGRNQSILEMKKARDVQENTVGSDEAQRMTKFFADHGVHSTEGMTVSMMRKLNPELAHSYADAYPQASIENQNAADKAVAIKEAELPYELAKEGRGQERSDVVRSADFQKDFQKAHANDLDIAGLIQDIEHTPGGAAPQGFAERFRSSLLARNIDPARLESWQAKQMILELWSREQSGAAISGSEDGKFITQVGMNPTATPEQVEAAYNVMGRVISRRLRGGSAPNKAAARSLGSEYGLDNDRWFGPEQTPTGDATADTQANELGALPVTQGAGPKVNTRPNVKPPAPAAAKVRAVLDGKPVMIPAANLEAAKRKYGAKLVVQ